MSNDKPDETRVAGLLEDAEGQALTAQSLANVSQSLIRRAVWRETWMPRSALIEALFANADQFCTDAEQRIADADVLLAEAEALMAAAGEDNPPPRALGAPHAPRPRRFERRLGKPPDRVTVAHGQVLLLRPPRASAIRTHPLRATARDQTIGQQSRRAGKDS